jgi:hypothetical protein
MGKAWIGGVLVWAWLGLLPAAQAQYDTAAAPEPVPSGPSTAGASQVIRGPLTGKDVPHGPGAELALPAKGANAFGGDECCDPYAEVVGGIRVSAGVVVAKPFFENNTGFTSADATRPPGSHEFDSPARTSPWLGVEYMNDCGWGCRFHWWHFVDHAKALEFLNPQGTTSVNSANPINELQIMSPDMRNVVNFLPVIPGEAPLGFVFGSLLAAGRGADHLLFSSQLKLDVIDLECTRVIDLGDWQYVLSAGLRYARLQQDYQASRFNAPNRFFAVLHDTDDDPTEREVDPVDINADLSRLEYGRRFIGYGPTVALEVDVPWGPAGFSVYGNARAAILFGARREQGFLSREFTGTIGHAPASDDDTQPLFFTPFSANTFQAVSRRHDQVTPVAEVETGVNYQRSTGGISPFVQVGFNGQSWFGVGSSTSTAGSLFLLGVRVTVGFQY